MLNINPDQLKNLAESQLKGHRTIIYLVALLLLIGGIVCITNPLVSGIVFSSFIGVVLLVSGVAVILNIFFNRLYANMSILFSLIVGIAYLILGYAFLSDPLQSLLFLAIFVAILFIFGGVIRIYVGTKLFSSAAGMMNILIGILDFIIAYMLLSGNAQTSITLLTLFIGIELLFSSFTLFLLAGALKSTNK
ncbi:acid-resistance membrane protein [Providencia stuartii]|nr:acid-resistance membrane protein [Providencia stuartii]